MPDQDHMKSERKTGCAPPFRDKGKSPALIITTLGLWMGTIVLLGRYLVPLIISSETFIQYCVLLSFSMLLITFWLLGSYYIALVIFYFIHKKTGARNKNSNQDKDNKYRPPPVAILYPTCDDFQPESVLTCLSQEYPDFHVFILDDSRDQYFQSLIDSFQRDHVGKATVVRRPLKKGYKAGNVNYALRGPARDFPFFCLMDADERIPPNFLSKMMRRMLNHDSCAFVQANHSPNPGQKSAFADIMGQTILPFWSVLLSVKNRYGFVPCVGHGVMVRRSAWKEVGGFPEVASEDLAFSSILLERGLRGIYAEDVICHEDFPENLAAFKKQQQRYVTGVLQVLIHYWTRLFLHGRATLIEKIDFLMSSMPLYVPTLCLFFTLICGVGIPLCFGQIGTFLAETKWGVLSIPFFQTFDGRFQSLWTPLFVTFSIFFCFSPAFPMISLAICGKIRRPFRLLVMSNYLYMSTMIVTFQSVIKYLFGHSIQFQPTGTHYARHPGGIKAKILHPFPYITEPIFSVGAFFILLASLNFGLAVIALCPLLSLFHKSLNRYIPLFAGLIFLGIVFQIIIGGILCCSTFALPPFVFSIHF